MPTNRADFIATAKAVQAANKDVWGLPLSTMWPSEWLYTTALYQNSGDEVADDGNPAFNTPAGVTALTMVSDLVHNEGLTQLNLATDDDLSLFRQGKALFHIQGSWMLNSIKEADFEFGVMPVSNLFTTIGGATSGQIASRSHVFVSPKKRIADYKQPAMIEFIKWMGEHGVDWAEAGQVPAMNSVRETAEYKALPYHANFGLPENFRLAEPSPFVRSGYNPVFAQVTIAMATPNYNAQSLIDTAYSEARKLVKEQKELYS